MQHWLSLQLAYFLESSFLMSTVAISTLTGQSGWEEEEEGLDGSAFQFMKPKACNISTHCPKPQVCVEAELHVWLDPGQIYLI